MPGDGGNIIVKRDPINVVHVREIKNLQELVEKKEIDIQNIIKEKSVLEAENLNLKKEVQQKKNIIDEFASEKISIEKQYKKINESDKNIIIEKDLRISKLEIQLEEMAKSKNPDEKILKDLINTKLQFEEVNLYNTRNIQELVEVRSNLAIRDEKLQKMTNEIGNLNKVSADYQFEKIAAKNELDLIRSKFKTSFAADDMSEYLNSAIESFNGQVNAVDSSVNYIINGMDVELKAQVYKDEQSRMMLSSADIASKSDNSLSSIKFSIRAVPKL